MDEDVRAGAEGERQRELRPVDEEARRQLVSTRLQEALRRLARHGRQDGEDGSDRDVGVDVGRPVEWVDRERELVRAVEIDGTVELFRAIVAHASCSRCRNECLIGADVEEALEIAVRVAGTGARSKGGRRGLSDQRSGRNGGSGEGANGLGDRRTSGGL